MNRILLSFAVLLGAAALPAGAMAATGVVKITPLGGQDGEFCTLDRALMFEDPDGTRILYDAGRTVAGPDDPRLGKVDIILVSHVHGDHIGDRRNSGVNAGTCAMPDASVDAAPASNTVEIAVKTGASIVTGSEMPGFFAGKLKAAGGDPKKSLMVRFGAMRTVGGVGITTVPAVHSNGLAPELVGGTLGDSLKAAGLTAYVGPPTGYVLRFSNGLVAYLSGDTGVTAEQESVVRDYYKANLVVINIGDTFTTGPTEAAHVVNKLIKPAAVIPSHANEEATREGKVRAGTRTEAFTKAAAMPVHIPLSGKQMSFDGGGKCVAGC